MDRIVEMAEEEHEVDDDDSMNMLRRFREKRKRDERPHVDDGMQHLNLKTNHLSWKFTTGCIDFQVLSFPARMAWTATKKLKS